MNLLEIWYKSQTPAKLFQLPDLSREKPQS